MARGTIVSTDRREMQGPRAGVRSAGIVAACLGAALLAGCAGTRHGIPVAGGEAPHTAIATADSGAAPAAPEAPGPQIATRSAALPGDAAAVQPGAVEPEPTESFTAAEPADPDSVVGLGPDDVEALLGQPGLVRREAPAEVWQYQSRGCVLDVFLYQESADYQVVYLEARDGRAISAATAICLGSVLGERRDAPMS